MDYIISNGTKYFCGWDMFGNMKFVNQRRLAYRMMHPLAEHTLEKINKICRGYRVECL